MTVTVAIGRYRQVGTVTDPERDSNGQPIPTPDGDGGSTFNYLELDPPEWRFAIEKASVRASERIFAGTVTAHATYIMRGRFHPQITTQTRIVWVDRAGDTHTGNVLDVDDTEGAGVETVALVAEVVA